MYRNPKLVCCVTVRLPVTAVAFAGTTPPVTWSARASQLVGGTEAIQALMDGRSGTRGFCGKRLTASAYEDRCAVVPLEGAFYFICPDCRDRGNAIWRATRKAASAAAPGARQRRAPAYQASLDGIVDHSQPVVLAI